MSFARDQSSKGMILEIKQQVVLVDIGYKSEGAIAISEFEDEEFEVGDEIEVYLDRLENDEGHGRALERKSRPQAELGQDFRRIQGRWSGQRQDQGGRQRAALMGQRRRWRLSCPVSQIDIIPPRDLNEYVGKVFEFKIVKINDDRKNIVVSRREVIEQERSEQRAAFLDSVNIGDKGRGDCQKYHRFRCLRRPLGIWMACFISLI